MSLEDAVPPAAWVHGHPARRLGARASRPFPGCIGVAPPSWIIIATAEMDVNADPPPERAAMVRAGGAERRDRAGAVL